MWLQIAFALYLLQGLWHELVPLSVLFEGRKDHSWEKEKEVNTSKTLTVLPASERLPQAPDKVTAALMVELWRSVCLLYRPGLWS